MPHRLQKKKKGVCAAGHLLHDQTCSVSPQLWHSRRLRCFRRSSCAPHPGHTSRGPGLLASPIRVTARKGARCVGCVCSCTLVLLVACVVLLPVYVVLACAVGMGIPASGAKLWVWCWDWRLSALRVGAYCQTGTRVVAGAGVSLLACARCCCVLVVLVGVLSNGLGSRSALRGRWHWLQKCTERPMALPPTGVGAENALRG